MTATQTQLEKEAEAKGNAYAKKRGWWFCKFTSPGKKSVPDRLFIRRGRHVFIEWKREGEEPTPQQLKRHREMREHGAEVHWVDNLTDFMRILR